MLERIRNRPPERQGVEIDPELPGLLLLDEQMELPANSPSKSGSRAKDRAVRGEVETAADGKVAKVKYPDGRSREFVYDHCDGSVREITYRENGRIVDQWLKRSDGRWYQYKRDESDFPVATGKSWEGDMAINQGPGKHRGDFTYEERGRHQRVTEKAQDGSRVVADSPGRQGKRGKD